MKNFFNFVLLILCWSGLAFGDEFEDTLKKAEQCDAKAQNNLGFMYKKGKSVTQDYKQAVHWYSKAAEQGYAKAQNNLGNMYHAGNGITQDYKQAAHWYSKAAEQGITEAQHNLGLMYYNGEGVTQDYKLCYVWLSLAAAQGNESAINNRHIIVKELLPQQLAEAQELAAQMQYKIDHR